jgi:hypothetical protein
MSQRLTSILPLALVLPALLVAASLAKGARPPSNLPITTIFPNMDASGAIADIQSDGLGSYFDGVEAVTSFLTTNGYNGIVWGDWQFGTLNSTARKVSLSFANPIQVGNGGTAIPNPPFILKNVTAHIEDKCTQISNDMLTMSAGQTFPCPAIVHFFDTNTYEYRIYMGPNWRSETTFVQVTCNAAASDGCNDWYIDPIPAGHDGSGNPIPGLAIGRLEFFGCSSCSKGGGGGGGKITGDANRGDYTFRFHFHLTRP